MPPTPYHRRTMDLPKALLDARYIPGVHGTAIGQVLTWDGAKWTAQTIGGGGGSSSWPINATSVKTANYTAAAGDLVLCDISGGSFTVTLPTAPGNKALVGVTVYAVGPHTVTVACGGSDHMLTESGLATSQALSTEGQVVILQYDGALAVWLPWSGGGSSSGLELAPVAVQTSGYSADAGDFVPCNTTSAGFTISLPVAPADKTLVGAKLIAGTNPVLIGTGGSDVINAAGTVSVSLTMLDQGVVLEYHAGVAIWYVLTDDLPLAQLDNRYAAAGAVSAGGELYFWEAWR